MVSEIFGIIRSMRLRDFDYTQPYFYMVTLKRTKGQKDFSVLKESYEQNTITRLFTDIIKTFHETWRCIEPISCFSIMPDHIHLLIKIKQVDDRVSLPVIVRLLARKLEKAYFSLGGASSGKTLTVEKVSIDDGKSFAVDRSADQHLFEFEWHDWIVKREGQLETFTRYIRENPERAILRKANRKFFGKVRKVSFIGREWFAYGNLELLKLPGLIAIKGHRATKENSADWKRAIEYASRIGPGGAGVSTFMSPLEKAAANALGKAGGGWVVLSPEGFHERWHPVRGHEKFCAAGRMLFLSLYEATTREPTKKELYERCHEMGEWVCSQLPKIEA